MPPLEAKKLLFRMTVCGEAGRRRRTPEEEKLMFIDVRKAHLNAKVEPDEVAVVELPEEFWEFGRFAKLKRWLYGVRKAASGWEKDFASKLEKRGIQEAPGSPNC
eukprot:8899423-Lingulodinium_polyedra.AAC.1